MTTSKHDDCLRLISASFPAMPMPGRFFWVDSGTHNNDIHEELWTRLGNRQWPDITLLDWRMLGTPCVIRSYLDPKAFLYYLPSLLVGAILELDFLHWALEGIIPFNKHHVPRGKWRNEFAEAVSFDQRNALLAYVSHIRLTIWEGIDLGSQALAEHAETVWS